MSQGQERTEALGSPPRVLLVDCDQFFVQVARLEDPDGAGTEELLIVGGSPDGRGVVTSASYPVRAYGVRSAMPTSRALQLCPRAVVVPVSRKACVERSRAVKETLTRLSPVVQAASIDEFYLDLSGTERLLHHEPLTETARRIRREVLRDTEISVSVGGGTRRLVAKLAAGLAKPGGVHVVPPGEEGEFMKQFRLRDIPGVGPSLAQELEARGLVTVPDLLPVEEEWLRRWFGESRGRWLWERARGMDSSRVGEKEPRKSISSERTFSRDLFRDADLERELLKLASAVGSSLRARGLRARTLTVKIRDPDFRTRQAGHTLPEAVESDTALFGVTRNLLEELRRKRRGGVRLLGVGASSLVEAGAPSQLELFGAASPERETDRARTVSRLADHLKERFGEKAILPGRLLEEESSKP